jgi:phage terminase small subunit
VSVRAAAGPRPRARSRLVALRAPVSERYVPDATLVHREVDPDEPPETLSPASLDLWRRVVAEASFRFEAHHYAQLSIACAALDRAAEARDGIRHAGPLITGRYGSAVNPLIAVERECHRTALRALTSLHLDAPVLDTSRRPGPKGAAQ